MADNSRFTPFWDMVSPEEQDQVIIYDNTQLDLMWLENLQDINAAQILLQRGITSTNSPEGIIQVVDGLSAASNEIEFIRRELNRRVRLN